MNAGTITIDGHEVNTVSLTFMSESNKALDGLPKIGTQKLVIRAVINANDQRKVSYDTLQALWKLAYMPTEKGSIKEVKIVFNKDGQRQEAVCAYRFKGWISKWDLTDPLADDESQNDFNHRLTLEFQPTLNKDGTPEVVMADR